MRLPHHDKACTILAKLEGGAVTLQLFAHKQHEIREGLAADLPAMLRAVADEIEAALSPAANAA